jgi:hypothetical protein
MAKGLRSSRNKANNLKLRSKVFGPVEDARKDRLSAKLLELASKPKEKTEDDIEMVDGGKGWHLLLICYQVTYLPADPWALIRLEAAKRKRSRSGLACKRRG